MPRKQNALPSVEEVGLAQMRVRKLGRTPNFCPCPEANPTPYLNHCKGWDIPARTDTALTVKDSFCVTL